MARQSDDKCTRQRAGWLWTILSLAATALAASPALAAGPAVTLGEPVLNGSTVTFPVSLANAPGTPISGISADIFFPPDAFEVINDAGGKAEGAAAGAAATAAGKKVFQNVPKPGVLRVVILDLAGNSALADGVVAQVTLSLKKAIPDGTQGFKTSPTATGPDGTPVSIIGSAASLAVVSQKVTPLAAPHGTIFPNTVQSVSYNGSTTFTVTPDAGYQIASVTGCGGTLTGTTYTTGPVTTSCSVSAAFGMTTVPPSLGDLDGDGKVDVADALRALQLCVTGTPPTAAELAAGDVAPLVDGKPLPDGEIDLRDALAILRRAVGLPTW